MIAQQAYDVMTYRFLIVVRVHVKGEIVNLMKGFVTNDTFVGLIDAVS